MRGVANAELTPELVVALGRAAARVLGPGPLPRRARHRGVRAAAAGRADGRARRRGRRRRRPRGPADAGCRLPVGGGRAAGSHDLGVAQPVPDNGIKFFATGGRKLSDDAEQALEAELDRVLDEGPPREPPTGGDVGAVTSGLGGRERYEASVIATLEGRRLDGVRVVIDCANGAAFAVRDTRGPGPMLEAALAAGLPPKASTSSTSAWCRRRRSRGCAADGVPAAMISASHNPFADNGIKFFAAGGRKLSDDVEERLEASSTGSPPGPGRPRRRRRPTPGRDRRATRPLVAALDGRTLDGLRVVVDCANGAASDGRADVLRPLGRRRRRAPRRARRHQHQRRLRVDPSRRRSSAAVRRPTAPTSGSPSTATPTGCSPSTHDGPAGRRRPAHRPLRHRPARPGPARRRHRRRHRDDQPRVPAGDGRARHRGASRPRSATATCSRRWRRAAGRSAASSRAT